MRSEAIVIVGVGFQDPTQMHLAQDNDVVHTLTPDRSDQPFLRLAVPGAISTAVMTGNLANAVLSAMDLLSARHRLLPHDSTPLNRSLGRLLGFLLGCVVAAAAASLAGDWAWSLPAALAAVAIAVR
jgi:hypothetical protein